MSEKLTLADAMKYPGAVITEKNTDYTWRGILRFLADTINIGYDISSCRLVLRSIDQLTDAEKKCIDNICGKLSWENWQRSFEGIYTILSNKKILELFDYLRSRNIDIDGFIENGKAVKS